MDVSNHPKKHHHGKHAQAAAPAPAAQAPLVADIITNGLDQADGLHTARQGETAKAIAKQYGVPWDQFQAWNPHIFTDRPDELGRQRNKLGTLIYPGDELRLRAAAPSDQADTKGASAIVAKKTIDKAYDKLFTGHAEHPELLVGKAQEALNGLPKDDPEYAPYAQKVSDMRIELARELQPAVTPKPTPEQQKIQAAKDQIKDLSGQLADNHGKDQAKAKDLLAKAQAALAVIPKDDPDRAKFEGAVADMQKLYDAYFPPQKPEDPAVLQRRKDLDKYLDQMDHGDRSKSVLAIVQSQPEVVHAATTAQKTRMLQYLLGHRSDDLVSLIGGGSMNDKTKRAVLEVLKDAQGQGQLKDVLTALKAKDNLDDLFGQMGDKSQGVEMAKLFKENGVYRADAGYYDKMDYHAVKALVRASGFVDPPPPTLTSNFIGDLDPKVKEKLIHELSWGNVTPEESRMMAWIQRQQPTEKPHAAAAQAPEPQGEAAEPTKAQKIAQSDDVVQV